MTTPLDPIVSESAALRACNLPSTPRWRAWLREQLAHVESGGGFVFRKSDVDGIAAKIGSFAASTFRGEETKEEPKAEPIKVDPITPPHHPGKLSDRRGAAVQ